MPREFEGTLCHFDHHYMSEKSHIMITKRNTEEELPYSVVTRTGMPQSNDVLPTGNSISMNVLIWFANVTGVHWCVTELFHV